MLVHSVVSFELDNEPRALPPNAGLEHRPHLRLAVESGPVLSMQLHKLSCNSDGFRPRVRLQDRPATDNFLALGKGPVRHGDLAVGEPYANAVLARHQTAGINKDSVLKGLLYELAHRLH